MYFFTKPSTYRSVVVDHPSYRTTLRPREVRVCLRERRLTTWTSRLFKYVSNDITNSVLLKFGVTDQIFHETVVVSKLSVWTQV